MGALYAGSLASGGSTFPQTTARPTATIGELLGGRLYLEVSLPYGISAVLSQLELTINGYTSRHTVQQTLRGVTPIVIAVEATSAFQIDVRLQFVTRLGPIDVCASRRY